MADIISSTDDPHRNNDTVNTNDENVKEQQHEAWPAPLVIQPRGKHTRTLIILHGRGGTGNEFASELLDIDLSTGTTLRDVNPGYKWVFPTCQPCYAASFDEVISQWYDIYSLVHTDDRPELQIRGIRASLGYIRGVIQQEAATAPTGDVILGGISQGFTIASLAASLGFSGIGALVGFCSWMPFHTSSLDILTGHSLPSNARLVLREHLERTTGVVASESKSIDQLSSLPVYLTHCTNDGVIDITLGHRLRDFLLQIGHRVTWYETATGGHWIKEPEHADGLCTFLQAHDLV